MAVDDWMNPPTAKGERMNKRELATCFGMTLREVQGYLDRGAADAAAIRRGSEQHEWIIDSAKFWAFVLEEKARQARADRDSPRAGFVSAKTRHMLAGAIAVERKNAEAAAVLVTPEQVAQVVREHNDIIRKHCRAIAPAVADAIAKESDPATVERIMEDALNVAFGKISTEGVPHDEQ